MDKALKLLKLLPKEVSNHQGLKFFLPLQSFFMHTIFTMTFA